MTNSKKKVTKKSATATSQATSKKTIPTTRSATAATVLPPAQKSKRQTAVRVEGLQFLSLDEVRSLFAVITDKRDRAAFMIAYYHGLRATEIGLLQKDDFQKKLLRIRIHRVKGSIGGVYPLQREEARALKEYLATRTDSLPYLFLSREGNGISRSMLYELMRYYGELAKIPLAKRNVKVLRHSIAVHLFEAGADIRFVQDWLGHTNIQNTVIYTHLVSSTRAKKARELFLNFPKL